MEILCVSKYIIVTNWNFQKLTIAESGIKVPFIQNSSSYDNDLEILKCTGLVVEGGETNEHLDVDFSTAVDQQSEVLRRQVLQSVLRKHI